MPSTPESQVNTRFWTPPRWTFRWITRLQVWVYERSAGRIWTRSAGMSDLLLRTVGRNSGRRNDACLPYWIDTDGERIVVASLAGGPRHPGWYHNLRDRKANPELRIRDGRRVFRARAEILDEPERSEAWKRLVADRPFYEQYQQATKRIIPLVRLIETRPISE